MRKVVQKTLISFGMLLWVFLRPDDAFSFKILQQEVAEMFNTWAIFQYEKQSLKSIITLSLISKECSFLRPI